MPFIGKNPTSGFSTIVKDDLTPDGSTTAFTLSKNVASANDIAVFVGNVRQEPTDAYSVSGTTLTMTAAPASGVNFYVLHIAGTVESSVVPAAGTTVPGAFGASGLLSSTGGITNTAANSSINSVATGSSYASFTANTSSSSNAYVFFQQNGTEFGRITAENGGALLFSNGSSATERLRILPTGGITFNGDTAAANALDDYEEGTWSPVASPSGGAFNGVTVSGKYIKIGNLVNLQYMVQTNDVGTASGFLNVSGVPFSAANYSWPAGNRNSIGIWREDYNTGVTGQSYLGGTTIVHKTRDDGNIAWGNSRVYICNLWYSVS